MIDNNHQTVKADANGKVSDEVASDMEERVGSRVSTNREKAWSGWVCINLHLLAYLTISNAILHKNRHSRPSITSFNKLKSLQATQMTAGIGIVVLLDNLEL